MRYVDANKYFIAIRMISVNDMRIEKQITEISQHESQIVCNYTGSDPVT